MTKTADATATVHAAAIERSAADASGTGEMAVKQDVAQTSGTLQAFPPREPMMPGVSTGTVRPASDVDAAERSAALCEPGQNGYVGNAQCRECHQERAERFDANGHARSLVSNLPDLVGQGSGVFFRDDQNHRRYDQVRRDATVWHRESVPIVSDASANGTGGVPPRLVTVELPVRWTIGSGHFAHGFLLADGDHLVQSPVTWYSKPQQFKLAPGYAAGHPGMTRQVTAECLACHAGSLSLIEGDRFRPVVGQTAIACERCHGPGRRHVDHYESHLDEPSTIKDADLFEPSDADRMAQASICAQCHLSQDTMIKITDNPIRDFRPGENLFDQAVFFSADYAKSTDVSVGQSQGFSNHFEQLWSSQCWIDSKMTCINCHSPHHEPSADSQMFREACLACHDPGEALDNPAHDVDDRARSCSLSFDQRQRREDRCASCHMPKSESEIPHAATTQHRIAVYPDGQGNGDAAEDPPITLPTHFTAGEIAGIRFLRLTPYPTTLDAAGRREIELLATCRTFQSRMREGNADPKIASQLARHVRDHCAEHDAGTMLRASLLRLDCFCGMTDQSTTPDDWRAIAERAIALLPRVGLGDRAGEDVIDALAFASAQTGDFERAAAATSRISRSRRNPEDWYNLGVSLTQLGKRRDAGRAFNEALRIDGNHAAAYRGFANASSDDDPMRARHLFRLFEIVVRAGNQPPESSGER